MRSPTKDVVNRVNETVATIEVIVRSSSLFNTLEFRLGAASQVTASIVVKILLRLK